MGYEKNLVETWRNLFVVIRVEKNRLCYVAINTETRRNVIRGIFPQGFALGITREKRKGLIWTPHGLNQRLRYALMSIKKDPEKEIVVRRKVDTVMVCALDIIKESKMPLTWTCPGN